jgi:hypothetical protein
LSFFACRTRGVCFGPQVFETISFEKLAYFGTISDLRIPKLLPQAMPFPNRAIASQSPENQLCDRRRVLGALGMAGLGLLATKGTASAASPGKSSDPLPRISIPTSSGVTNPPPIRYAKTPALPPEWAAQHSATANDYFRYLASLNLQRVSPKQVISVHAQSKDGCWNTLPPQALWPRMGYVLRVVERIARELSVKEVEIISAYRNPTYNARCAGARAGSWHQANLAVDVRFPVNASQLTSTARELRDLGLFKGGVGGYWNFTHIDARGQNTDW